MKLTLCSWAFAATLLVLAGASSAGAPASVSLINETFDSYADGAWPAGFYQLGNNYAAYPNCGVVSGIVPAPPSGPKCFESTNPDISTWSEINAPFSWDRVTYPLLTFGGSFMLPLNNSTDDIMELDLRPGLYPTDLRKVVSIQLQEIGTNCIALRNWTSGATHLDLATTLRNDHWYALRGELNAATGTYNLYLDNVLVGLDLPVLPGMDVSQIGDLSLGTGEFHHNTSYLDDVTVSAAPEPATLSLLILAGLLAIRRRHRQGSLLRHGFGVAASDSGTSRKH